jgi:hypothetical protein
MKRYRYKRTAITVITIAAISQSHCRHNPRTQCCSNHSSAAQQVASPVSTRYLFLALALDSFWTSPKAGLKIEKKTPETHQGLAAAWPVLSGVVPGQMSPIGPLGAKKSGARVR